MKYLLPVCLLAASTMYAKPSNIERVDRYLEDRNCKPHIIKAGKHLEIYRTCNDTYVITLDDDGEILSAVLHNENGQKINLMPKE
ncbi:MAG: hypothetical protein DSZ03_02945 [Sulfurimonas sp.]|nr:MAG: hypothetical protein DSZ03_02945 [Sulfurimonas sp.]